jgi:hypothetical protein
VIERKSWWEAYQLRQEKSRRLASERSYFFECRRERQIKRNKRLAEKVNDGPMLVLALRFYVHHLSPGALTLAEPILEHCKGLSRRWRLYLKIARRVLGIGYQRFNAASKKTAQPVHPGLENRTALELPHYWQRRLQRIGLCLNPAALGQFERLSPDLQIDASAVIFADARPYLVPNVQRLLLGEAPPLVRVAHPVAEADTVPPGSCGYLMHSSEDANYSHVSSPFKIAKTPANGPDRPRFEPSNDYHDAEW